MKKPIALTNNQDKPVPQLQKGDTFVRKSKYGHCFGIVDTVYTRTIQSVVFGCSYEYTMIKSTNGIKYEAVECYKVNKIYNKEELIKLTEFVEGMNKLAHFSSIKSVMDYKQIEKQMKNL